MKEYTRKLLDKALDTIEGAEGLTNMGKAEMAAGRAYYAMFYVAEALLYNEFDLKLNQHGQVIAAYGKNFAKTKALDPKYHRWLRDGFEKRISGDYGVDTGID
ncbi:MAG: HEPN domain-containing protein [Anaerolineales bacterium]